LLHWAWRAPHDRHEQVSGAGGQILSCCSLPAPPNNTSSLATRTLEHRGIVVEPAENRRFGLK